MGEARRRRDHAGGAMAADRFPHRAGALPPLEARRSTARSRRSRMDVDEDGGLLAGLRAQAQLLRPRRRHRARRRGAAAPLRAPRGARSWCCARGKDRVFCAGANIRMLAGVDARLEGELLQVHQRDAQRHRGRERATRARSISRAVNGTARRRRLRAGAGLRRHHAGRRPLVRGVAARGAAARRAARHRRPDPRHRQAQGAPRPRRRLLHHRGRRAGPARGRSGGWSTRSCRARKFDAGGAATRASELAAQVDRPADAQGHRADAARAQRSTTTRIDYRARRRSRSTARRAHRDDHGRGPDGAPPADVAEPSTQQGAAFWPLRLARELDDAILHLRTNELEIGTLVLQDRRATPPRVLGLRRASSTPTQAHWLVREIRHCCEARAEAPRRDRRARCSR